MSKDYRKLQRQIRKESGDRIAADLRNKDKKDNFQQTDKRDKNLFDKGIEWFKSGLPLEDAPDEVRTNTNFINGFNKGKRLADIDNMIYEDGRKFFLNGGLLEDASDRMKNNSFFIKGYNDEAKLSSSHKL